MPEGAARLQAAGRAALGTAVAATVYLSARFNGSYFATAWPFLGALLVVAALALLIAGRRPSRWVAASAASLAAFGVWSLLSVAWGGLPQVAWATFDESLLAAAALVLGSQLAGGRRRPWIAAAVAAGVTIEAVELLYRLQAGSVPAAWFDGRKVQGLVGYANAQGGLVAVAIPITIWFACTPRLPVRALAGAASGVLVGALLVTQSRGAVLALAIALPLQAGLARSSRIFALSIFTGLVGAALWWPLRRVDDALVVARPHMETAAFHHYAGWVLVGCFALAAVAAAPPHLRVVRRGLLVAAVASVLTAALVVALVRPGAVHQVRSALRISFSATQPQDLPGGSTRLTSVSLSGRSEIWRVAWRLYTHHAVVGAGRGQFALVWARDRTENNLYVLQPHSIELETLSELGIPGTLLFLSFVAFAFFALVRRRRVTRAPAAAGVAVLAILFLQASIDWTFSFPAFVVAVLLVVGAVSTPARRRLTGRLTSVGLGLAAVAVLVGLAGPYLSARTLGEAAKYQVRNPTRAWQLAARARGYDRWNPDVIGFQGRIAETTGRFRLAAALYERAATLTQQPWVDEFERARALHRAGLIAASRAACRTASTENPLERRLQRGPCA